MVLLKCRNGGHCFSETRGRDFSGRQLHETKLSKHTQRFQKGSIRGVADSTCHDKSTSEMVDPAGKH